MSDTLRDGVAIVGLAGRFPGAADVDEFWANLVAGRDTVSFFSDAEMAAQGIDVASLRSAGGYVAARGVLEGAERFDAAFFGIPPREAEVMDPQQRIFLETCWTALEHAGYAPGAIDGLVGVFGGSTYNTYYLHALHGRADLRELVGADTVMFGNERDYLATRVAYKLGLRGPALNVSTACSTSLVAVCQACSALLLQQCDTALAGGVSVTVPQQRGYRHDEGNIGSADGRTRTFDVRATGTVFGNGVGVVVLKRVEDAIADGDTVYAVIRGAALNNDGSARVSFGAPGVEGQADVIATAHALAGIEPASISYVEAHGTATPIGDPIEVAALTKAFRLGTDATQFCGLGSVKTNIGHLDAAAGVAGLIKTTLSLHRELVPASLHFEAANPKLQLESSPFFVNAALRPWTRQAGVPRRAGVSAFGSGGTNAHVVLEEAPASEPSGPSRPLQVIPVSARTPAALEAASGRVTSHLEEMAAASDPRALADAAYTLQRGRHHFAHRRVVVAADAAEAAAALVGRSSRQAQSGVASRPRNVVFMFPGQGAQYAGMGRALYRSEPVFRDAIDDSAAILGPLLDVDIRALLCGSQATDGEAERRLMQTRLTQPALFAVEYALARLWMSWGVRPVAFIGHSIGEYVAACLADVFTLEDALTLVARRGAMVQQQPAGAMLAVRLSEDEVLSLLPPEAAVAAVNARDLCVVAGPQQAVETLEAALTAREVNARRLRTSHAFHSPMMDPVVERFAAVVRSVPLKPPVIPYVSNVTARWITDAEATSPDYWASHVRHTVRFADALAELLRREPEAALLEVGPGRTLTALAHQHPGRGPEQPTVASLPLTGDDELRGLLQTLGRLWSVGVPVDWAGFSGHERRHRVALPTYPFERTRHWPEPMTAATNPGIASPAPPRVVALPPPAAASPAELPAQPRLVRLQSAVRALVGELSGHDVSAADGAASLLELGFESLLLTQLSQLVQRRFGVPMTFRLLMEEVDSIDALVRYLDGAMPPDQESAVAPAAPALPQVPASQTAMLEALLQQQAQLTSQVLALLGRVPDVSMPTPAPAAIPASSPAAPMAPGAHGPFRPIDRTSAVLSPIQREALDAVIARYVARTATSKRMAAEQRAGLADPRSASGFKPLWKEMVYPIVTTRSDGSTVVDVDGHEYVDFVMGFGASLFGHRPPFVVQALHEQLEQGFEIGPIQPLAAEVAALIREFTGLERVAFTNTGSEAVLAATRLARTVTGRDKIAIFAGAYHGIFDEVLSRPVTRNGELRTLPIAQGIPESAVSQVLVLEYGTAESLVILRARGAELAAILVEPVQSRRLDLQPGEFLKELRRVADETGAALVFDEVVTGFRVHPGGAQAYFDVKADLATYGKVVGGGLPIGIVAGAARFMDALDGGQWQYGDRSAPEVGVTFFAGTFVRHPLALAAARAVLTHLREAGGALQQRLADRASRLAGALEAACVEFKAPFVVTHFSSLLHVSAPAEQKLAGLLFYLLREHGIHCWENRAIVLTTAHSDQDLDRFVAAFRASLAEMRAAQFYDEVTRTAAPRAGSSPALVPLTDSQMEVWLACRISPLASASFNEIVALEFTGIVAVSALQRALAGVVARHDALRATVVGQPPAMCFASDCGVDVVLRDVTRAPEPERELDRIAKAEDTTPFDLERGPLVRATLVTIAADRHVLLVAAHHLVCDGWSFGIVVRDLAILYSAEVQGTEPSISPPVPVSEFAREWHAANDRGEGRQDEQYWLAQYSTLPEPLELPTDRPRPAAMAYRGGRVSKRIDAETASRIRRFASRQRSTVFATLLGAFETLIFRLTGQEDFAIGIPIAGQSFLDGRDLVGHCVNYVPMRAAVQPGIAFHEHLVDVRRRTLEMAEHQRVTMGRLLGGLRIKRDPSRHTLVSVGFTVERALDDATFAGLDTERLPIPRASSKRDLEMNLSDGAAGIDIAADFDSDLFDAATVERWLDCYACLLDSAIADPSCALSHLRLLPGDQQRQIEAWNATDKAWSDGERTIDQLIAGVAAARPERVAVETEGQTLTYGALNARANQLAHHLRRRGVVPGAMVGIAVERSIDLVVGVLGILKAGAAYLPLDPMFPEQRLAYMLADSGAEVLLTHRGLAARVGSVPIVVHLDADNAAIAGEATNDPPPVYAGDRLAYVLYTSGSTGKPKGVAIPHRALRNLLESMRESPGCGEADTLVAVTTLSFDIAGLEIFLPLLCGARVVVAERRHTLDPRALIELMRTSGCTLMQATPTLWQALIDGGWVGTPGLRALCGGEALSPGLATDLLPRCRELWNMYGPTETTIWSTCRRVTRADAIDIGGPLRNTELLVLDAARQQVPVGVDGELYIGGLGLATGYVGRPDLTAERFVPHPFKPSQRVYRTGDRARWRADGSVLFLGRLDEQVKLRGFRIELGEVQAALRQVPGVDDAVVVRREDSPGEARLVAYVIGGATTDEMRARLMQALPEYAVPSAFVSVTTWPQTPNGKIDRKALPAPVVSRAGAVPVAAAQSATVRSLAACWRDVLHVGHVDEADDFFLVGGDSLRAMRVLSEVHREWGVALTPADLFTHSTLGALAARIDRERAAKRPAEDEAVLVRLETGGPGTPLFWVHGIGGEVFSYQKVSEHIGHSRPVYGFAADWSRRAHGNGSLTVEEMAALYVREMRQVQPSGPYHIGGFCAASMLALEMARQVEAAGERVGTLVVLDYMMNPRYPALSRLGSAMQFFRNAPWWVFDDARLEGFWTVLSRLRSKLRLRRPGLRAVAKVPPPKSDVRDLLGMWRFPDHQVPMLEMHHDAIERYVPKAIAGKVCVFLPRTAPLFEPTPTPIATGWETLAQGGLDVAIVAGSHSTMMVSPFAGSLAQLIDARIGGQSTA